MRVLMISNDKRMLDPSSETAKRIDEYRQAVGDITVAVLGSWFEKFSSIFFLPKKIKEVCGVGRFDIITTQDPFLAALAGYRAKKRCRTPLQIQIHTDVLSPYYRKESLLHRVRYLMACRLIPRSDCIRVVSERIKNSLLKRFKNLRPDKIVVLPMFVDTEVVKNHIPKTDLHQKYPGYDFIILMASRFTREKNIEFSISAIDEIVKEFPKTLLLIVGDGPEKDKYKTGNNVKIEGWADDLVSYHKTADLYLLTSNYEGYGRTLVEAAAAGCKVVSSDVGIAREVLEPENIFRTGDKGDLIRKIKAAIKGEIRPTRPLQVVSKEEYLTKLKESWQNC